MVNKIFKYFINYKDAEKIELYAYSVQKWVYTKQILIKLRLYFLIQDEIFLEKYNGKKLAISSKRI